ncbi:hypothetical protein FA13DRAFT_1812004 [Coprinellus micaceus]|uniref:Sodium/calcium exchanger membrane region domain-containing protein n=1 Tax=Coprinellus micaceus TaxID=71717 RepID=A0A4Y7TKR0_COPMI|nr:hypothetical protein FA13DRAFT_1812004 [Coprinellus micaceus]
MPPKPLDIIPTASLSERYYVEQSPTNSEFVSSPPDTRFVPYLGSDSSDTNLVSSSSEGFKSTDNSPRCGLPSYYRAGSDGVVEATTSNGDESRATSRTNPIWRTWRRHLLGWRLVLFDSWLNVLLIMIPIAWTIRLVLADSYALVFSFCILALVPLVRLHDITIGQLALRIGGSKTALLNASMSNFVEVVLAISALRKCELRVVQSSLVGSILGKLLLILGLCFFAGGLRFSEQGFDQTATQVHSSLLSISVGVPFTPRRRDILKMSHGVSIILITIYLSYLAFQLWSHTHLYQDNHNKTSSRLPATQNISVEAEKAAAYLSARSKSTFQSFQNFADLDSLSIRSPTIGRRAPPKPKRETSKRPHIASTFYPTPELGTDHPSNKSPTRSPLGLKEARISRKWSRTNHGNENQAESSQQSREQASKSPLTSPTSWSSPTSSRITWAEYGGKGRQDNAPSIATKVEEERMEIPTGNRSEAKPRKEPELSWFLTVVLMLAVTAAVSITADWLVESMDGISSTISKEWIALILLPAVSSVAECITAIRVSVKDELSLSVSVAIGSTIQTALLVVPLMVVLGWITNKPLTLLMDPFESLVLYLSVQTTSYVLADGKSNWLEGVILISLYLVIAVAFWFYPGSTPLDFLTVCPRDG